MVFCFAVYFKGFQKMTLWLKDDVASRRLVVHRAILFATVTLFVLFVFQPFGTNNDPTTYKFLRLAGYGLVTFCALLLCGTIEIWLTRYRLSNPLRLLLVTSLYVGIVAVFNHSYFVVAVLGSWNWQNQLLFVLYTLAIGLFPICFMLAVNRHAQHIMVKQKTEINEIQKNSRHETSNIDTGAKLVTLTGQNKSDLLKVVFSQIAFIKSADNYCEIAIIEEGHVNYTLLRSSLIDILKQLPENSPLCRCHRSYAVNVALVEQSSGNAGGLQLLMKSIAVTIPVSRTYVDTIKQALLLAPKTC